VGALRSQLDDAASARRLHVQPQTSDNMSEQVIIGITGTNGAGKGTVVEYLMEKLGFQHYSARGYLNKILTEQGKELSRSNMSVLANSLRAANHPSYLAEQLLVEAQKAGGRAIIESIRTPAEAHLLRKNPLFKLLAVDADTKLRYERAVLRGSSTDKISYDQFVAEEKAEMSSTDPNMQNISKCFELADATLHNNGSLAELQEQVDEYLATLKIAAAPASPAPVKGGWVADENGGDGGGSAAAPAAPEGDSAETPAAADDAAKAGEAGGADDSAPAKKTKVIGCTVE
jgi:dephospho-CoA kinase